MLKFDMPILPHDATPPPCDPFPDSRAGAIWWQMFGSRTQQSLESYPHLSMIFVREEKRKKLFDDIAAGHCLLVQCVSKMGHRLLCAQVSTERSVYTDLGASTKEWEALFEERRSPSHQQAQRRIRPILFRDDRGPSRYSHTRPPLPIHSHRMKLWAFAWA